MSSMLKISAKHGFLLAASGKSDSINQAKKLMEKALMLSDECKEFMRLNSEVAEISFTTIGDNNECKSGLLLTESDCRSLLNVIEG